MKYQKLFNIIKENRISPASLTRVEVIKPSTLRRLRNDECVSLYTLDLLSAFLGHNMLDCISGDMEEEAGTVCRKTGIPEEMM